MAQVWLRLEAIAQQHGVADALQALLHVRSALQSPLFLPAYQELWSAEKCLCPQRGLALAAVTPSKPSISH